MLFRDLAIGQEFSFSRSPESGLLADLDVAGQDRFRKLSARTYECATAVTSRYREGERWQVGSIRAKVWA